MPESEASSVQLRTNVRVAYVKLVNMVLNVHRNRKAYWGRGEGAGGGGGGGGGRRGMEVGRGGGGVREIIYPSLHCHHQNDFCIKVGSDERHFNVS